MLTDSWIMTFMIVVFYFLILVILFTVCYLIRFIMDKVEESIKERARMVQGHKDSVEIVSMVDSNEVGCNIDQMFEELDINGVNTDFKYKI